MWHSSDLSPAWPCELRRRPGLHVDADSGPPTTAQHDVVGWFDQKGDAGVMNDDFAPDIGRMTGRWWAHGKPSRSQWTGWTSMPIITQRSCCLTGHGRATPLVWLAVDKDTLKDDRNNDEHQAPVAGRNARGRHQSLDRGRSWIGRPQAVWVMAEELKFDYLIGFRGNIKITVADGEKRAAVDGVGKGERIRIRTRCPRLRTHPVGRWFAFKART
jgi:hypothetical protein